MSICYTNQLFYTNRLARLEKWGETCILITAPILPTSLPPLLPPTAVKRWFAQLAIDFVVRFAQPVSELVPASGLDFLFFNILLKILGAYPARVELGKEPNERGEVVLLRLGGSARVRGCYRVKESPGAPAERLNIGWAVCSFAGCWGCRGRGRGRRRGRGRGRGRGALHLLGLRSPCREGCTRAAGTTSVKVL